METLVRLLVDTRYISSFLARGTFPTRQCSNVSSQWFISASRGVRNQERSVKKQQIREYVVWTNARFCKVKAFSNRLAIKLIVFMNTKSDIDEVLIEV